MLQQLLTKHLKPPWYTHEIPSNTPKTFQNTLKTLLKPYKTPCNAYKLPWNLLQRPLKEPPESPLRLLETFLEPPAKAVGTPLKGSLNPLQQPLIMPLKPLGTPCFGLSGSFPETRLQNKNNSHRLFTVHVQSIMEHSCVYEYFWTWLSK